MNGETAMAGCGGNIMWVFWGIMALLGLNMVAGLIVAWRKKRKRAKRKGGEL